MKTLKITYFPLKFVCIGCILFALINSYLFAGLTTLVSYFRDVLRGVSLSMEGYSHIMSILLAYQVLYSDLTAYIMDLVFILMNY